MTQHRRPHHLSHTLKRTNHLPVIWLLAVLAMLSTACNAQWPISSAEATQIVATVQQELSQIEQDRRLLTPGALPPPPTPPIATPVFGAVPLNPTATVSVPPDAAIAPSPTAFLLPTMAPAELATLAATAVPVAVSPAVIEPETVPPTLEPVAQPTLPPPQATVPPELGYRGDTWTVLFSPGGGEQADVKAELLINALIEYIDAAQSSIHLAVYEMNLTPVADALIRAHNRGVDVRFITDDEGGLEEDGDEGHGQFAMLQAAGIEVRADTRSALMHNKFIIIDNTIFITGSTNLTYNDFYTNNNNMVAAYQPEVAAIYEREFDEMWNGEFGPTSTSQPVQAIVDARGQPFVVMYAPEDDPFDTLVALVSTAQSSIRFMAFSFTNDALGLAMLDRFNAGVDVSGIFEVRGSETEYAELPRLYCAGVPVRQDGNPQTYHHKVVVIDNYVVITGSMNFSDSAADDNDENMVAISDPEVAQLFIQEFDRNWARATEAHPEDMNCQ